MIFGFLKRLVKYYIDKFIHWMRMQKFIGGNWKQTSYNNNIRKNYAGIGFTYDASRDAFIPPQPFPSWTLVEDTCQWEAPTAYPSDGKMYSWNESSKSWEAQ